jgi:ABC-type antimicrobial peptide transport system permease subunit
MTSLNKKKEAPEKETTFPINEVFPYRLKDNFLTPNEYKFYKELSLAIGDMVRICPKVGLKDVMDNDLFSIPTTTPLSSYVQAGILCAVAVIISGYSARRKIARFDMVEVLKERE